MKSNAFKCKEKSKHSKMRVNFPFLTVTFLYGIAISRATASDEVSPSRSFFTTLNHRRLTGFTFNTFRSGNQVSCALQCERNPRCVSTNFRKSSSIDAPEGICELNDKGVSLPLEEKDLQYDKDTVYIQFYDTKHDCHLTSCKKANSCTFSEASKVFKCERPLKSCAELYKAGKTVSGVYTIDPDGSGAFDVFCDQTTAGGGWTVFQRRIDGSVDFNRGWADYKTGFGNLNGEFWLGLDRINRLTQNENQKLVVNLEDWEGETRFSEYESFVLGDKASKYRLSLGPYTGTAGDSLLTRHNGQSFSTKDQDNDSSGGHCAVAYKGGWWYNACHYSNLNGLYHHGGYHSSHGDGINWYTWRGHSYSHKQVAMKIRPVDF